MKIFETKIRLAGILLLCFASVASAFTVDNKTIKNKKIFGIEFPDNSSFYAQAAAVVTVSKNEYIVGNAIFVTEVTVSLSASPNSIRIYHAMPLASEQFEALVQKKLSKDNFNKLTAAFSGVKAARGNPYTKKSYDDLKKIFTISTVHKDYPATTHSKNLEFAVQSLDELEEFYARISSDFGGFEFKPTAKSTDNSDTSKSASDDKINPTMNGRLYILEDEK